MRVLIDAHMVGEHETGNETYMANLLRGLARINVDDEVFIAATHPEAVTPLVADGRGFTVIRVSAGPLRRLVRDLPGLTARFKPDVLFATYAAPLMIGCPMVVAVHDVSFKRHPEWFSPRDRLVLNLGVGITVRRAASVITLSEFSKREIEAHYPVPGQRIRVTPLAPAPEFNAEERNDAEVRARYGIRKPYLLAVGNLQPRKNLVRLIEAFGRLVGHNRFVHDLVLVGKAQWQGSEVGAVIERLALSDRVKAVGYVSAEDLPPIYRGADVFVYPSLYEGFGLPVLEAMACGTPVVASDVPAITEVAGAAARLVDPRSVEDLAAGMAEMCAQPEQRALWRQKGLAQSRMFTWERTARQTLDVLHAATSAARSR